MRCVFARDDYESNVEPSLARVTVTGTGGYSGTLTTSFSILESSEVEQSAMSTAEGENSLSRASWDCVNHVAWIPKCRRRVPRGETRRAVGEMLGMPVERMDGVEIVDTVLPYCPGIPV